MTDIKFSMGICPTATHQQKKINWRARQVYEPDNVKKARKDYKHHLAPHVPDQPLTGPLAVQVVFFYGTQNIKRDGEKKSTRPDLDNSAKLLLDCMTQMGFWSDDAQITTLHLSKYYGAVPMVWVQIGADR